MCPRIDDFAGPLPEYVLYLERIVVNYRRHDQSRQRLVARQDTPHRDSSPASVRTSLDDLQIVLYQPSPSSKTQRPRKKPRTQAEVPRWKEQAVALIRDTPRADSWTRKLKETGIFDAMCGGTAVSHLLLLQNGQELHEDGCDSSMGHLLHSTPLTRIAHYARVAVQRGLGAAVATALANYQKFLVLSSCAVLIGIGTSAKDVHEVVRICIGNTTTDEHCRRILRGCLFVHELMDNLYMGGWGLRAFELLLIWNRSPTFYSTISESYQPGLALLKDGLCTHELTANMEQQAQDWTPIFAPKIVYDIVGGRIDIAQVASTLGYKYTYLFETRVNTWEYEELLEERQRVRIE